MYNLCDIVPLPARVMQADLCITTPIFLGMEFKIYSQSGIKASSRYVRYITVHWTVLLCKIISYICTYLKWELKFNVSKCNVLHLRTTKQYTYFLCGTAIQSAQSVRDLGVVIDQDLKFHEHTSLVTNKANRVLGLIKSGFAYLDPNMLVRLYKSMVRPILEYGNIIWGPHYLIDQKKVETIQRRATKLVMRIFYIRYLTAWWILMLMIFIHGHQGLPEDMNQKSISVVLLVCCEVTFSLIV